MRGKRIAILSLLLASALHADQLVLRDGTVGEARVQGTSARGVTVEMLVGGKTASLALTAAQLDPHCFYQLRQAHMGQTAANHLELARFCAGAGMFARAQYHLRRARQIDPLFVDAQERLPRVRDGFAAAMLTSARAALSAGRLAEAERWVALVLRRYGDTLHAAAARGVAGEIASRRLLAAARRERDRLEAIDRARGGAERRAVEARVRALRPALTLRARGRHLLTSATAERNASRARRACDEAAAHFERALGLVRAARPGADPLGRAQLDQLERGLLADLVEARVDAGSIALNRASFTEAERYARKALAADPQSGAARAFHVRVRVVQAIWEEDRRRRRREAQRNEKNKPGKGGGAK